MAKKIFTELKTSVPFWICLVASICMEIAGMIIPPQGVIDGSVITGVGFLFGFAVLWCVYQAIEKGIDARIEHGDTTIELGDLNDGKEIDDGNQG